MIAGCHQVVVFREVRDLVCKVANSSFVEVEGNPSQGEKEVCPNRGEVGVDPSRVEVAVDPSHDEVRVDPSDGKVVDPKSGKVVDPSPSVDMVVDPSPSVGKVDPKVGAVVRHVELVLCHRSNFCCFGCNPNGLPLDGFHLGYLEVVEVFYNSPSKCEDEMDIFSTKGVEGIPSKVEDIFPIDDEVVGHNHLYLADLAGCFRYTMKLILRSYNLILVHYYSNSVIIVCFLVVE